MADREDERNEALRWNTAEKMWLNYLSNELLALGLITESMHRKMKLEISPRKIALGHRFDQGQFSCSFFQFFRNSPFISHSGRDIILPRKAI